MARPVADEQFNDHATMGETMVGRIKWFDRKRGFGFIVPDDGSDDVLIHCTIITAHGRRELPDGTHVTYVCGRGPRGRHVERLLDFELPPEEVSCQKPTVPAANGSDSGPVPADFHLCTVKWFSRVKGFGFLTADHLDGDIFLHMELLRAHGLPPVTPGNQIYAHIVDSGRGPVVDALHGNIIPES